MLSSSGHYTSCLIQRDVACRCPFFLLARHRRPHTLHPWIPITTPDGRYLIVRGRLWRATNPGLGEQERQGLVNELMDARRAVKSAKANGVGEGLATARQAVDSTKRGLGERGPVWWTDGAPDWNRHLGRSTPYAGWFKNVDTRKTTPRKGSADAEG